MARREVHLALWDALVIEGVGVGGGHSMDMHTEQGDRCQKEKVRKKKKTQQKN